MWIVNVAGATRENHWQVKDKRAMKPLQRQSID